MDSLASRRRRAKGLDREGFLADVRGTNRGGSIVEVVVAMAVLLVGVLAFSQSLSESLALGEKNRETALATAAAQGIVEELQSADFERVFALYNDDPEDDPEGSSTAPGARFAAAGLEPRAEEAGLPGRIFFPVAEGSPAELREDLLDSSLGMPLDLDLDGVLDGEDHAGDYRLLPVRIRVAWLDGSQEQELEVATILGAR